MKTIRWRKWLAEMLGDRRDRPSRPPKRLDKLRFEPLEERHMLAVIPVTTNLDVINAGDGVLSLREAIIQANSVAGADTITLPAGTYTLTISGKNEDAAATGDLDITSLVTLVGAGQGSTILQAGASAAVGIDRIFDVRPGGNATISDVTLRHGNPGITDLDNGGGIRATDAPLTLQNVAVINNIGERGAGITADGGVGGTLTIIDSVISNNQADNRGGGIQVAGPRTMFMTRSTVSNNTTTENAGGIALHLSTSAVIYNSTISSNTAANTAGGILTFGGSNPLTIVNSTISNNSAVNSSGGIHADSDLSIINSTITGNNGDSNSDGAGIGGGIILGARNQTIHNTIVAGNFKGSTPSDIEAVGDTINTASNNLIGNATTSAGITHGVSGNIVGNAGTGTIVTSTVLNPTLANNGGTTLTHALVANGLAINAGSNAVLTVDPRDLDGDSNIAETLPVDQRGHTRAFGSATDIGAFESTDVVAVGTEFRVNTTTAGDQRYWSGSSQAVATDPAGNYIIAWDHNTDVYAQRYSVDGTPLGSEFRVNTYTTSSQTTGSLAIDSSGNFLVTWYSNAQDGSTGGVYAQRYNASGVAQGSEFRVNTYTTSDQSLSTVGMDSSGNFVVVWASAQDGASVDRGIFAQRYNSSGVAQGSEFRINTYTTGEQVFSSVAMNSTGAFVVTWSSVGQDGGGYGIYAQRYNAAGVLQGTEFRVNTYTTGDQTLPTVAISTGGDFVIAWASAVQDSGGSGVYAQRYTATGTALGSEFRVNTYTTNNQIQPDVSMAPGGDFVVTWASFAQDISLYGVYAQRYKPTGEPEGNEFRVNSYTTGRQRNSAVAMNSQGGFVVTWHSQNQDGNGYGVYAQRYAQVTPTIVSDLRVTDDTSPIDEGERLVQTVSSLAVTFSRAMNTASVQTLANWSLTKDGSDISGQISSVVYNTSARIATVTLSSALTDGEYVLTAEQSLLDSDGEQLDGDANNSPGGNFVRNFEITPPVAVGSEFRVNSYTTGAQLTHPGSPQSMAMDAAGNFVVTWSSPNQPGGNSYDVYAQRYNAAGVAQGGEFKVNTYTTNLQRHSTVAMDADGDFVITWSSFGQDGSWGVHAQRYNAAGVAQGSEFRVNTYTMDHQRWSTVAMDTDGDFVISWESSGQDGSFDGVYAQRYNAAGVAQGSEFRVNTYTTNSQDSPTVAIDSDGDFVITWSSGQDGSVDGVYAQRYNAAGVAQGGEFQVNTYTTNYQHHSTVAMDSDGDFVITWESTSQDGSGYGVYAQRYTAAGMARGGEFKINTSTTSNQRFSRVAIDSDGDFVIIWTSAYQDGSSYGVYAQRYNAGGVAQGSEFRVNTYTTNSQFWSTVAMDSDGDFVVAWSSSGQDGSNYGVYAQRYSLLPAFTTQVILDGSNNLVITDGAAGGQDDALTIKSDTTNSVFIITDPNNFLGTSIGNATGSGTHTLTIPFASVAGPQISVLTLAGNDSLTVDFSLGNFAKTVFYDGGTQTTSDNMTLTGGGMFAAVAHTLTSASSGSVFVTSNSIISYTGLEPITDNLSATDRAFAFAGGAETITLADAAGGNMTIDSTLGESVTFANPTSSLTIHAGSGNDTISVNSIDAAFAAALTINGEGETDTVHLNAALNTGGAGAITITAEQINVGAGNLTTNGGAVTLNGKVALTGNLTIDTNSDNTGTGGAVTISTGNASVPTLYGQGDGVANLTLTIETSSTNATAGNVNLGRVKNNDAALPTNEFLAKLTVNADGATDGVISLTSFFDLLDNEYQSIKVNGIGAAGGVEMIGTVSISLNALIDTNQTAGQDAGPLDFDQALITSTVGGANITLDASASGAGQGGNVRLGDVDDAGAAFQRVEGLAVYAYDSSGPTGSITFTDRNGDGVATINFDGGGSSYFASTMTIAAGVHLAIDCFAATPFNTPGTVQFTDATDTWNATLNGTGAGNEQLSIDASGIQAGIGTIRLPRIGNLVPLGGMNVLTPNFPIQLHGDIATIEAGSAALNGVVDLNGDVTLTGGSFDVNLNGATAVTLYDQLRISGGNQTISLNNRPLNVSLGFSPVVGAQFKIVDNVDSSSTVSGTFQNLPEGAAITVGSTTLAITYLGGTNNNDVVLTVLFDSPMAQVGEMRVVGDSSAIEQAERLVSTIATGASLQVMFTHAMSQVGGAGGANSVTNPANWMLTQNGSDISSQITSISYSGTTATLALSSPLASGDFVLTAKQTIQDSQGAQLDGDNSGSPGGNFVRNFEITPPSAQGNEFQVNTFTTGAQKRFGEGSHSVANDAAGNFVVTWSSDGQDGNSWGVYAQRFNSGGAPVGSEFRVNTYTTGLQINSSVAMDADGDFVITWTSQGQFPYNMTYARRYDAAGVPQGAEFQVPTGNSSNNPSVSMDSDGDFVVTWDAMYQDGISFGIAAQRYNASGGLVGSVFNVNSYTTNWQRFANVAMDAAGNFVVTWQSQNQNTTGYGVYGRRFNSAGAPLGSEFRANTSAVTPNTLNVPRLSNVAMGAGGDFVVTWSSLALDGSNYGVYAQRYNAASQPQGSEFRVNTYTTSTQRYPMTAVDADGDFVITWTSDQDGSGYGIYAQRYSAGGVAQGSEFRVNTSTNDSQRFSSVAMDSDGDFVIAWNDYAQDGESSGVFARRYTLSPPYTTQVTLDGSNNLVITDGAAGGQNDTITINSDTTNNVFIISDPNNLLGTTIGTATGTGTHTLTIPFASVAGPQISVLTLAGNDSLTVDFSLGNFSKTVFYDGGTQTTGDSLTLTGGSTFATVTHTFADASSGNVSVSGNSQISYTGLEPVTDNLSAANRVFTFTGGAETITLTDATGANMTIDSTLGEAVTFANPTGSLTINAGSGNDTVTVTSVDANGPFNVDLTINGGIGNDTVNLNTDITFAAGKNLDVDLQNDDASPGNDSISIGANANLTLSGTGAATLKASRNIALASGSSLEVVNGNLTLEANQQVSPTSGSFDGIDVNNALVRSTGTGVLDIKGRGGNSGAFQAGVHVRNGGDVFGGTAGLNIIQGIGGASTANSNIGVWVQDIGASITTGGGSLQVVGQGGGGGTGAGSFGVYLFASTISAGGTGNVDINGTGGPGSGDSQIGVWVQNATALITSSGGNVSVTGQAGNSTSIGGSSGVYLLNGATISAGGSGTVAVNGSGGGNNGINNHGVLVDTGVAKITSSGGAVQITGAPGFGSSAISVIGTGSITTATGGGSITLIGDQMNFDNTAVIAANGASAVTLRQKTNGTAVSLGTEVGGQLSLTDAELDRITAGTVQIGDANSGNITISAAITHGSNLSLNTGAGIIANQSVTMAVNKSLTGSAVSTINLANTSADLAASGTGAISLTTARDMTLASGSSIVTANGNLTLSANQQVTPTSGNFIGIDVSGAAVQISGTGNLSLSGRGGDNSTSGQYGVYVHAAGLVQGGTTGATTVLGTGGATSGNSAFGVYVNGNNATIASNGGNVQVTGLGGGSGSSSNDYGVYLFNGGQITAGGNGNVLVQGTGGATSGSNTHGVALNGGNATITSSGGNVQVTGLGGGSGASGPSIGVYAIFGGQITAGGNGTVTVQGTGGATSGSSDYGVHVFGGNATITSSGGNVQVTGIEGGGASSRAINLGSSASITTAANGGNVTLIGNSMEIASTVSAQSGNSVTLRPYTSGVAINVGTTSNTNGGPLGLSDSELDNVSAGTIQIGDSSSGTITVSAAVAHTTPSNFALTSGGNISFNSGTLNTGGGNLSLTPGATGSVQAISSGTDVTTSATSSLTFAAGSKLSIAVNGATVNTQYNQLNVAGQVNLTGVNLVITGNHTPLAGQAFTIVDNDGADPVIGAFNGLAEGATVNVNGVNRQITYVGGSGNDVVLNDFPLQIVGITPTPTGFIAEFNHAFEPSTLNLYDEDNVLGAADVKLIDSTMQEVRGSLLIDSNNRKVTFLKSGGVLSAGNYTVQLISGTNAFKLPSGGLFDGNTDGTPGGNYSGNLTIASPAPTAITLGIPDFTRGYGQAVNVPAPSTGLPITISNAQGVKSASFALNYDPTLLSITGATVGAGITGNVTLDTSVPGVAQITVTSTSGLSSTAGLKNLISLTALVPNNAPYSEKHLLDLVNLQILDTNTVPAPLPAIDNDGIHIAAYFGDANGSQSYNAPDATQSQRLIVGSNTGLSAYQLADPYLIVDISGNGQLQSDDVTQIQRAIVGLSTAQIPPHPGMSPAATGGPDPIVSIPQNLAASVGETITVPVELLVTEPTGITLGGADIAIAYDASTLELTNVDIGQLLIGFGLSVNTSTPGLIRLTLGGSPLDLEYFASGVLATLQFTVIAGAGKTSSINLLQSSAALQTALYDAVGSSLTLSPAPTDSDNDEVDGLISIMSNDQREATWQLPAVDMAFDSQEDFTVELEEFVGLN